MRLTNFRIKNFRGYLDGSIGISDLTTIVGANDAGKSTIFEALDIFLVIQRLKIQIGMYLTRGAQLN